MWLKQVFISFFYVIDRTLFNFIPTVYDFIMMLSRTSVLTQGQIKDFAGRIQMLLGVFMLFKVAFSIITYIVNPDDFSDKSKGFAKLWQNAIISLILLVLTPYAFNMAYEFQKMVLEENAIGNLILGEEIGKNKLVNAGQEMAYSVMIPFFSPNVSIQDLNSCVSLTEDLNGNRKFTSECRTNMYNLTNRNPDQPESIFENYVLGVENKSVGLTFRLDIAKETAKVNGDEQFIIDYNFPISTAVAIVVLLLLVTYCMDIALRSVKLAFLQLISPIPIISYIDPKGGKDGMFSKWYKMCFSTYISLFVRLAVLYFGVYIISMLDGNAYDIVNGSTINDRLINVVIIIGVLMFIKQFPKILEGLGIKLDGAGKFQLNPFKKFEEEAFGGKQILGAGAAVGAGIAAGAANFASIPNRIAQRWRNAKGEGALAHVRAVAGGVGYGLGSVVAGQTSAIFRGSRKMMKGEKAGKIFADSYGEAMFAKLQREDLLRKANLDNAGMLERAGFALGSFGADVARWTGNLNMGQREYLTADEQEKKIKFEQDQLDKEKLELSDRKRKELKPYQDYSSYAKKIKDKIDNHKLVKDAEDFLADMQATGDEIKIEDARKKLDLAKKNASKDLFDHDIEVQHYRDQMNKLRSSHVELQDAMYNFVDSSGYFDKNSIYNTQSQANIINDKYTIDEQAFEARQEAINAEKQTEEYIRAHNENSRAKLQNSSRFGNQVQQPGYKPSAGDPYTPYRGVMPTPPPSGGLGGPGGPGGPGGGTP